MKNFIRYLNYLSVIAVSVCISNIANALETQSYIRTNDAIGKMVTDEHDVFWTEINGFTDGTVSIRILKADKGRFTREIADDGTIILQEQGNSYIGYGSIATATVNGTPYVYFVVNKKDSTGRPLSYINRIPANGGTATGIASPLPMGNNDLKIDNQFLYWVDREAVRKIPLNGGTPSILARVPNLAYEKQLALDNQYIYYNKGNNGELLYRTPKTGGNETLIVAATSTITDIDIHENNGKSTLYWGELNGSTKSVVIEGTVLSPIKTYQEPTSNIKITSIATDGTEVFWTDCPIQIVYDGCRIRGYAKNGDSLTLLAGASRHFGIGNIIAETDQLFWSNSYIYFIVKYIHPAPLVVNIDPSSIYESGTFDKNRGIEYLTADVKAQITGGDQFNWWTNTMFHYGCTWHTDSHFMLKEKSVYPFDRCLHTYIATFVDDGLTDVGSIMVKVTDAVGRTAKASATVTFTNPADIPTGPGPTPLPQ